MGETDDKTADEPDELKALFEKRRDEGKENEEILREVFESNPDTDIKRLVEVSGLPSLTIGRIKGQVAIRRKRDSRASEKQVEEGELSEPDARQLVAQYGREGLNKLKRRFLRKTLSLAPSLSEKTAEWILHKWDINPRLQDDPNDFYSMLHNDAGLKPNLASSIAKDVFSLEEQYADILEDKGERPIFIRSGSRASEEEGETISYRRSSGSGPFEVSGRGRRDSESGGFLTREEYLRLDREKEDRRRTEQAEEKRQQRDDKFKEEITGSLNSFREELEKGKKQPLEEIEEIPIDAEGKPTTPENAVSVKKITRGSGGALRTDPFDLYLKMKQAEKLDKAGQMTSEEIRRIIKEETKPTGPSAEITALNSKIDGLTQRLVDRDKELSEKERQDLKEQIADLKTEVRGMSTSGINSTEGMLASVGGKLVDKNPLKEAGLIVERLLTPSGTSLVTPAAKAPPVAQQPGTSSGIIAALKEKGLVTTIRERVVGPRQ